MTSSSDKSAKLLGKRTLIDDLETKSFLKKHKEQSEDKDTTDGFPDSLPGRVELLETKSDQTNFISEREKGLHQTPHFVEGAAARKKTLFISNLSPQTGISYVIDFFKDVGQVVRVRLLLNLKGRLREDGFVEFASANEAENALQKKNCERLYGRKTFLDVATKEATCFPPKYCIDHKVWCEDYLRRENLMIEDGEAVDGLDETRDFVQEVLFVANLSPQTKMLHIVDFFKRVGEVVSVRLIANNEGKHVGHGFVEFPSANIAKKVLENKNGEYLLDHKIFLDVAKRAPYPPRPKINLAEKLWYEDYLRRESLLIEEEDEAVEGFGETPDSVEAVTIRKKTLFVAPLSPQTEISHIISFFRDVGEVVHVRLFVNNKCKHIGFGFVEFASANETKEALEKKNGEYLGNCKVDLRMAKIAPYPPPVYCIDHKVWYEDYLRQESILIEEDEAVEGLDEAPDFVEEVALRKKTLFVINLPYNIKISNIISFFRDVGEVSRVRLLVNQRDEFMDCGFVEFASANEIKKALLKKNGEQLNHRNIFLYVAERAPYPLRPKYILAEKLWSEDYVRRFGEDYLETRPKKLRMDGFRNKKVMDRFCNKKITFSSDDDDEW